MNRTPIVAAALSLLAGAASAHIVMVPDFGPPGAAYAGALRVAHGCKGAATTVLRVEIPAGVAAEAAAKPGWTLSVERVGGSVRSITWQGLLPGNQPDTFPLTLTLPASAGPLYLPTIQTCETGEERWTDIPLAGQGWHDIPHPAPVIRVGGAPAAPMPTMGAMPGMGKP